MSLTFVDHLKSIFERPPWPHHLAVCRARYDEARRELPEPDLSGSPRGHASTAFGLQIEVDDTVPPNEIHFVSIRKVDGEWVRCVDKIVNVGA